MGDIIISTINLYYINLTCFKIKSYNSKKHFFSYLSFYFQFSISFFVKLEQLSSLKIYISYCDIVNGGKG